MHNYKQGRSFINITRHTEHGSYPHDPFRVALAGSSWFVEDVGSGRMFKSGSSWSGGRSIGSWFWGQVIWLMLQRMSQQFMVLGEGRSTVHGPGGSESM